MLQSAGIDCMEFEGYSGAIPSGPRAVYGLFDKYARYGDACFSYGERAMWNYGSDSRYTFIPALSERMFLMPRRPLRTSLTVIVAAPEDTTRFDKGMYDSLMSMLPPRRFLVVSTMKKPEGCQQDYRTIPVSPLQLRSALLGADILLQLTKPKPPYSRLWHEASALGVPCVVSPGIVDGIRHGQEALFAADAPEALDACRMLQGDADLAARIVSSARAFARERCLRNYVPQLLKVLFGHYGSACLLEAGPGADRA